MLALFVLFVCPRDRVAVAIISTVIMRVRFIETPSKDAVKSRGKDAPTNIGA
jgi:hypothetical protein